MARHEGHVEASAGVPLPRGQHPPPPPTLLARPTADQVAENATGDTSRNIRNELDRMHLVTMQVTEGRIAKRSATTTGQRAILAALQCREPAQILDYQLPADPTDPS